MNSYVILMILSNDNRQLLRVLKCGICLAIPLLSQPHCHVVYPVFTTFWSIISNSDIGLTIISSTEEIPRSLARTYFFELTECRIIITSVSLNFTTKN
jgi:hypothetical protein